MSFESKEVHSSQFHAQTLMVRGVTAEHPGCLPLSKTDQPPSLWMASRQDYPRDACIPALVAQQAQERPQAPAVVTAEVTLSYQELNRRANQLAHYLRALGVRPGVAVGLYLERSPELIVGLLAILKAGGAYVPLDPSYPRERLAFMLEDAQVPVLVTIARLAHELQQDGTILPGGELVCLDEDADRLCDQPIAEIEDEQAGPGDLAYVIYTSGSTGRPKGVEITHDNLLNLIFWHQRAFSVQATDRASQVTSPAFDATGWEIWPYLACGASVYLPPDKIRLSAPALRDWLVEQGITIAFLPTPLAEQVIQLTWPAETALRFLLTGADTLHRYPRPGLPFILVNNYGPTETTVVATSGPVPPASEPPAEPPSIGWAIANTSLYILDERLQPVPWGMPGELYIGGQGVARGYRRRPELTAERFLPDPFAPQPGARMYRTGDRARFLPDGQLAFLGRLDNQVKLRGYRIELDEIATVLNQQPGITASVVVAHEERPGEKQLVAYVVSEPDARLTAAQLRTALARHLPDYMLPSTFVRLESLPLTAHGKIDRAALPIPSACKLLQETEIDAPAPPSVEDGTAPAHAIEQKVAEVVCSLLGRTEIDVTANFFMLGGHSLLGAQLILRLTELFGVQLSLHTLFTAPTVRQLAARIEQLLLERLATLSEQEAHHLLEQLQQS
ncbi:non-ribosomal peptide synthetase [Thermogemmatispora sp.]|uniref:non-ribosomal peptide synthetase n=1 Tax=Thermogemmatispora sp. TaxID=1968838 RepID=UPI001DE0B73F|nr:amino acid adenylation domain-containing protein [Thermogemmatispora sp.]MBX5449689.1 amino acid adenylation domain-containing protein [Thermogemmatispora sp.]